MLKYPDGKTYATFAHMVLTGGSTACLVGPSYEAEAAAFSWLPRIEIPREYIADCIVTLQSGRAYRVLATAMLGEEHRFSKLVYTSASAASRNEVHSVSARKLLEASKKRDVRYYHINITEMDIRPELLARAHFLRFTISLDVSRLPKDSSVVDKLICSGLFRNLRWLDLSGNQWIDYEALRHICDAVRSKRLPSLEWLDLLGTQCDASPYIDGYRWRMTDEARALAEEFGFQRWMMLGAKIPELAGVEVLTSEQRGSVGRGS